MRLHSYVLLLLAACADKVDYDVVPQPPDTATPSAPDLDNDGVPGSGGDCNDLDSAIHPGVEDDCDDVDNDCDGLVDEDATLYTWNTDADGDGAGHPGRPILACAQPDGATPNAMDCNDNNPQVFPGAPELCNGMDDNCDGVVDGESAIGVVTWYADVDGDGFGDPNTPIVECPPALDGFVANADDCDDRYAEINPRASELCDGLDNDCDGDLDENSALDALEWWADVDADGYGDMNSSVWSCDQPSSFVDDYDDCDDAADTVNPAALEYCNGFDDDCDLTVDEDDAVDATVWYADADGDGQGIITQPVTSCAVPTAHVASAGDCDDSTITNPADHEHILGQIILLYPLGTTPPISVQIRGESLQLAHAINEIAAGVYSYSGSLTECDLIAAATTDVSGVLGATLNGVVSTSCHDGAADAWCIDETIDDPDAPSRQWNMDVIDIDGAWCCSSGAGVTVAVIDSGVSQSPADGIGTLIEGSTCISSSAPLCVSSQGNTMECSASCSTGQVDDNGHGTHVAGTIGQATNNGSGVCGAAFGAQILPVKAMNHDGRGTGAAIATAIVWASNNNADVINLSLGGDVMDETRLRALDYASQNGVFLAMAAGNANSNAIDPTWQECSIGPSCGGGDGAVLVGALSCSSYSNCEPNGLTRASYSNYGSGLELMAPGTNIAQGCTDGSICTMSGTSMATPHVAASAALLISAGATASEAEIQLKNTAWVGSGWSTSEYGHGLIQPGQALEAYLGSSADCTDDDNDGVCSDEGGDGGGCVQVFQSSFASPQRWIQPFAATYSSSSDDLFLKDVNGDERADVVFFNASSGSWHVAISGGSTGNLDAFETGLWDTLTPFGASCGLHEALMADVNGDFAADAVVVCSDGEWYRCLSDGGGTIMGGWPDCSSPYRIAEYGALSAYQSMTCGSNPARAACGETPVPLLLTNSVLDGAEPLLFCDGTWDTWTSGASDNLAWCWGDEDGTDESWVRSFTTDLTGDGTDDLVFVSVDGDWHARLGEESFATDHTWGSSMGEEADELLLGDVNNDGFGDLVAVYQDNDVSITHPLGNCVTDANVAYDCDSDYDGEWRAALGADSNGDGRADSFSAQTWPTVWAEEFGQTSAGGTRFFLADVNADGFDDGITFYQSYSDDDESGTPGVWKVALGGVYTCEE